MEKTPNNQKQSKQPWWQTKTTLNRKATVRQSTV